MKAALSHVWALWGRLWFVPAIPLFYAVIVWSIGDLRPEHVVFGLLCSAVGYAGPRAKRFLLDVSPYVAVAMGYDLVRYARPVFVTADRVIGCELRDLELVLFGFGGTTTPQDFFTRHHNPFWDLYFAVPYSVFVYVTLGYAIYLYFVDRTRMRHYLWAFAIANYLSFLIWLILPAAPPWYIRAHGCGIDISALPSPAALARVDDYLGVGYFKEFYSRAASVFGAVPSMHCAYPLLGMLTARHAATPRTWPLHVLYVVSMFVASVYLDHHWVIDGILGWIVAFFAVFAARKALLRLGLMQNPGKVGPT
jgi:hypothetical protein